MKENFNISAKTHEFFFFLRPNPLLKCGALQECYYVINVTK